MQVRFYNPDRRDRMSDRAIDEEGRAEVEEMQAEYTRTYGARDRQAIEAARFRVGDRVVLGSRAVYRIERVSASYGAALYRLAGCGGWYEEHELTAARA